jgi:proline iminopeptidase
VSVGLSDRCYKWLVAFARVDGDDLFYQEVGVGRPCLVMHGGLGVDHTCFRPWLDRLGDVLRLVYYDHRGNGRSGRSPLESITLAQLAADADALRAHLGPGRVAVLGHSFGGMVALEYALRYPERVSHLILVDTAAAFDHWGEIKAALRRNNPPPDALAAWGTAPTDDLTMAENARATTPLYFARYDPAIAESLFADTIFSAAASRRGSELLQGYDVTARLGEIAAPTLVLVGSDDFVTPPSQAERIQRRVRNADLAVIEHCGHHPYAEQPEAFAAAVRGWLAKVG